MNIKKMKLDQSNETVMSFKKIKNCRVCGNSNLVEVLHLGNQTLTGVFPKTLEQQITVGPLTLVKCHGGDEVCHLLQLQHEYDLDEMYGENYGYRSGLNAAMVCHLRSKVSSILRAVPLIDGDLVLDIGSNDGTTLGFFPVGKWDLVGMDPTGEKFSKHYKPHIQLIPDFFSVESLRNSIGERKAYRADLSELWQKVRFLSIFFGPLQNRIRIPLLMSLDDSSGA